MKLTAAQTEDLSFPIGCEYFLNTDTCQFCNSIQSILTNHCATTNMYEGPVWYNFIQCSIGNVDMDVEIVNQPQPILKRVSISISIINK